MQHVDAACQRSMSTQHVTAACEHSLLVQPANVVFLCSVSMHSAVLQEQIVFWYLENAYQVVGKDIGPSSSCKQEALDHAIAVSSKQLH